MGYMLTKDSDDIKYDVKEYVIDAAEDLGLIPKKDLGPGSSVLCLKPTKVYILNTLKEWVEL